LVLGYILGYLWKFNGGNWYICSSNRGKKVIGGSLKIGNITSANLQTWTRGRRYLRLILCLWLWSSWLVKPKSSRESGRPIVVLIKHLVSRRDWNVVAYVG
jgi:hypothetical protein